MIATSNSTFLGVPAQSWSAWGVWITCLVYVGLARIAYVQYRESQRLRADQARQALDERASRAVEQAERLEAEFEMRIDLQKAELRPFVLVDIDVTRRTLLALKVENTGRTAATDVAISLDSPVESSKLRDDQLEWQQSPIFTGSGAMLAPGQSLSFPFDLTEDRFKSDLPERIVGSKSYRSYDGSDLYEERFEIDLSVFRNALLAQPGFRELIKELAELRKALPEK